MEQPTDQQQQQATTEMAVDETLPPPTAAAATDITKEDYPMKESEQTPPPPTKQPTLTNTNTKLFPFSSILLSLETYQKEHGNVAIPTSHPTFTTIVNALITNGMEDETDKLWERNFKKLQEYHSKYGDCDIPFTDPLLGGWITHQRKSYAASQLVQDTRNQSRFQRLANLTFDFEQPLWDVRLRELMEYQTTFTHVSPPVNYPKLGIWVVNQRFNLKDMSRERVKALDALGFVWNHNRKNRSQVKWDQRYEELLEFVKQNGHCNVPATYRHSPLGTWVGKQREEYKKMKDKKSSQLDKYRIDKLNEVSFQWSLQSWTVISWDDRFDALKKFKEQHGHCKIPRNHPDFGNWPIYQKAQYKLFEGGKKSKITAEKVDRLISIGFLETKKQTPGSGFAALKGGYDAASYDWNHQV